MLIKFLKFEVQIIFLLVFEMKMAFLWLIERIEKTVLKNIIFLMKLLILGFIFWHFNQIKLPNFFIFPSS